jgi:hypothetical protein
MTLLARRAFLEEWISDLNGTYLPSDGTRIYYENTFLWFLRKLRKRFVAFLKWFVGFLNDDAR